MAVSEPGDLQRDKLLSRLLAESLAAPAAKGGACPDAETMAAYADRSLTIEQAAQLDAHFASCSRCQNVLAAMAVSLEALPELPELPTLATIPPMNVRKNIQRSEQSLHPAHATVPSPAPVLPLGVVPRGQPTRWRQLAPALGIAAAVALWFAFSPEPLPQTLSAQLEAQKEMSAAQTPRAGIDSEIAEANIPAPPSHRRALAAPAAPAPPSQESQQLSADASQADTLQRPAAPRDELKKTENAENSPSPESNSTAGSPAVAAEAEKQVQAKTSAAAAQSKVGQPGALSAGARSGAPAFAAPAAPAPAPPAAVGGIAGAGNITASATPNVAPRAQMFSLTAAQVHIFASRSRAAMWRVGAAGSIERSADRGQTWEKQASGVFSDLVAGEATSDDAAWVVGRAGVILRTTDGAHWQRVSLPSIAANPATMRSPTVQSATTNSTSTKPASPRAASPANVPPANVPPGAARSVNSSSAVSSSGAANLAALDWAGIEARDALHATVIAANGRRFTTSDGGQTWTAQ